MLKLNLFQLIEATIRFPRLERSKTKNNAFDESASTAVSQNGEAQIEINTFDESAAMVKLKSGM